MRTRLALPLKIGPCNAKVEHLDPTVLTDEDVGWLDVAMHHVQGTARQWTGRRPGSIQRAGDCRGHLKRRPRREAALLEQQYAQTVRDANATKQAFDAQMAVILDAMQDMEEKRGHCLRDALLKQMVYETSWLRNVQYDIEGAIQAAEAVAPKEDIEAFRRCLTCAT